MPDEQCLQIGKSIGFIMTYRCNLDCTYCYIPNKLDKEMPLATAQTVLEPVLEEEDDLLLEIMLMGAETLYAFPVIKELVEWTESKHWNRPYIFMASTNGTLLTPQRKSWFREHRKTIILGLSYDGLIQVHDLNRSGSASQIDLDFFLNTWPHKKLQMTVNEASVSHMADGVMELTNHGFQVHANVAYEEKEWSEDGILEYERQLEKLIPYYLSHPEKPHIYQFVHPLISYAYNLEHPVPQTQQCSAGTFFTVYDVDGQAYPCHILSPLVLPEEKMKNGVNITDATCFADPRCVGCPYITECSTCIGCNYLYRNSFECRDITHCKIIRLEVMACMKLMILRLLEKPELTQEDVKNGVAIIKLMKWHRKQG